MNNEERVAVTQLTGLIETAILALEQLNITECANITAVLRETRKHTDLLYTKLCQGE